MSVFLIIRFYNQRLSHLFAAMLCCMALSLLASCAAPAYQQLDKQAVQSGFTGTTVQGDKFRHVVYTSAQKDTNTLHVYIEGDGVNWQWNRFVKADPTPDRSLMLGLMKTDPENALYLGRPCYLGLELDDGCDADYWTYERFSQKVVNSMVSVVNKLTGDYQNIVLIGHSGGGALALLMAEQLPAVNAVVTIAGIVDTDAWTSHHGYTRLVGSLNPAKRKALPETIKQLHLTGGRDANMPASLVRSWVERQSGARLWEIPQNSHVCCWTRNWPSVLLWLKTVHG